MAIQIPNPGTGNGASGDNEFVLWSKVKDNFSDQTHAASKLIGKEKGQIPLAQDTITSGTRSIPQLDAAINSYDFNNLPDGEINLIYERDNLNAPPRTRAGGSGDGWYIHTLRASTGFKFQIAYGYFTPEIFVRALTVGNVWTKWTSTGHSLTTYLQTTGTAPNVVVESDGTLKRSTSSEKYKDIISSLELDDETYRNAISVKPIIYRSKANGDPDSWHFMSFSAEELGAYDPCLTQWRTHEQNEEGEHIELEQKEAEGINLNAICAVLHATNIKQAELIKALEDRVTTLEAK